MEPRLFLFDIDGTLVHVGGAGRRALGQALGKTFEVPEPHGVLAPIRFDGSTDRVILKEMVRRAGIAAERFAAREREFEAAYLRALRALLARGDCRGVLPGVIALLDALRARGDALGLLTGNSEAGARAKLEPFGLNPYFPAGAFGSDHEDRRVLAALAHRRLQDWASRAFAADRVFVVGDSVMDVRAGKSQGFRTVAVLTGWSDRERLAAEEPDHLLEDLTGLAELTDP